MFSEESEGERVFFKRATCESLVGVIETAVKVLLFNDLENSFPLGFGWVDSSWVVSACVEEDKGAVLSSLEVILHTFEVETLGPWLIVSVVLPFVSAKLSKVSVKWPGWVWNEEVDILVWIPVSEESESDSE